LTALGPGDPAAPTSTRSARPGPRARSALRCLVVACAAGLLFWQDPERTHVFGVCPLFWATGLFCSGCGALRAAHALLHGRILQAAAFNVLSLLTVPVIAGWAGAEAVHAVAGRRLPAPPGVAHFGRTLTLLLILFTLARNVPLAPFALARPHRLAVAAR
jgi:hypothetical protein